MNIEELELAGTTPDDKILLVNDALEQLEAVAAAMAALTKGQKLTKPL